MSSKRNRQKPLRERTELLLKEIGASLKYLRSEAGYGNSTVFAIQKGIPEGSYGKHEAGLENMTLESLVSSMEAHGLKNEDVFNEEFLELGRKASSNSLLIRLESDTVNQVRHQVSLCLGADDANSFSNHDIKDLRRILIEGISHSSKMKLIKSIDLSVKTPRFGRLFDFLIKAGWLAMAYPTNTNHPQQKYYTTDLGKSILRLSGG